MAILNLLNKKYKWEFVNIGGSFRVSISSGEDLAHLAELDPKMWTVLSCPTTELEISDKSLKYMDCDGDGKIRVNDVVEVSQWITGILKDKDLLLKSSDNIDINSIDSSTEVGQKLYNSAKQILQNLGKEGTVISLADTADITAIFAKTRFNGDGIITAATADDDALKATIAAIVATIGSATDRSGEQGVGADQVEAFYAALAEYSAWYNAMPQMPYADKTDAVIEAYNALDQKVRDFFMRSKLAAFSPNSTAALDIQTSSIEAISAENLAAKSADIAAYPLTHISGKAEIDINAPINPAWDKYFQTIKTIAVEGNTITEEAWDAIAAKLAEYTAWKAAKAGASVESLGIDSIKSFIEQNNKAALLDLVAQDLAVKEESENIEMVDRFLYIFRDFYRLVKNFVTLHDFYDKSKETKAIFQCGKLIIDQRECHFCMRVDDAAKHSASAGASGMYLLYCDCTTKSKPGKMQIVATVTVGDIGELSVGKNGIFYDNSGLEWDAVITKIIDNPINISQSFWSPYRRMATAVENLINKSAADKDAKMMSKMTAELDNVSAKAKTLETPPAAGAAPATQATPAAPPFDIAKFAGIFAALGMAVGMIGTALTSIFKGLFALKWWQVIMLFAGIIMVVSGPAMVMAWLKLRRRNIAPLLNANGWAVNAMSKISIPFGETLTDIAKYPKIKLKDPYAKKGLPKWQRWTYSIASFLVVMAVLWLLNIFAFIGPKLQSPLPWFNKEKTEVAVEEEIAVAAKQETVDSTAIGQ
ncbi:MAG: hypothetical protein IKJ67_05460 [Bacteroidales bacterium]|nr:hypothetical protein [Bacteroidales bacterium]